MLPSNQNSNVKMATKVIRALVIILCLKILGYFTLTENIAVTRVLKIVIRLGMTFWLLLIVNKLKYHGAVFSFKYSRVLSLVLYIFYLILGFSSLLWSTNPGYSLLQLTMNTESLIFAILFIKTCTAVRTFYPEVQFSYAKLLAPAVFFILLSFVIGMFINPDVFYRLTHGGEEARLGGYLMNPNELGMLAVVGIASAILNLSDKGKRWLQFIMILVMFYALILTGSRSSLIGFFLIVFYFILKSKRKKLKVAIFIISLASIPLVVNTIFIKQGDIEEVLSMTGRLPFWKALLTEGLPKEPYLGFGYMRIAYTEAFQSVHTYAGKMTHNTFIQVLMNLGFVGFTIVFFQLISTLVGFIKSTDKQIKLFFVAVFVPIIINSFTEFGIFGEANFGILFYQLLIAVLTINFNTELSKVELLKVRKYFPHLNLAQ